MIFNDILDNRLKTICEFAENMKSFSKLFQEKDFPTTKCRQKVEGKSPLRKTFKIFFFFSLFRKL